MPKSRGYERAARWASVMSRLREQKPRPLNKWYKNPTPAQVAEHRAKEKAWNAKYRRAQKEWKKEMERGKREWV